MEPKSGQKPPSKKNHVDQLNRCTLCPFTSYIKSTFQRHLMKSHGVKLKNFETSKKVAKLGRVANDYGLNEKFTNKEVFRHSCRKCLKQFSSYKPFQYHKQKCNKKFKRLKGADPFLCDHCDGIFASQKHLKRHLDEVSGKRDVCCQICAFKCFTKSGIQRHLIDQHNLICKIVEEPDFDQALDGTPYTLERAVEFEALPRVAEVKALPKNERLRTGIRLPQPVEKVTKKLKKIWTCDQCNGTFKKLKHLKEHEKYDNCAAVISKHAVGANKFKWYKSDQCNETFTKPRHLNKPKKNDNCAAVNSKNAGSPNKFKWYKSSLK